MCAVTEQQVEVILGSLLTIADVQKQFSLSNDNKYCNNYAIMQIEYNRPQYVEVSVIVVKYVSETRI